MALAVHRFMNTYAQGAENNPVFTLNFGQKIG